MRNGSSHDGTLFQHRSDAGVQLATALELYRGDNPLVLGIRRDAMPVAYEVARQLGGELGLLTTQDRAGALKQLTPGRTVILVDDGLASSSMFQAAIGTVRARGADPIVVGLPVAYPDVRRSIAAEADVVVCLHPPMPFLAIRQHYRAFPRVKDDEVKRLLGASGGARSGVPADAS